MGAFYQEFLKKETVKGVIFDVDGTLLDSMPVWAHSGERYLATLGIHAPASLGKILFSLTMQQGAEYMKKTYQLSQTAEEIQAGVRQTVAEAYGSEPGFKKGAPEFLSALRKAEIPTAVVTSTDRPLILAAFRRLGIENCFQKIFTCSEFGSGKDEPAIFHAAVKELGTPAEHTWVFEDALYAIRTAKAAGFPVTAIADAFSKKEESEIRKLADYFITDFVMDNEVLI